MKVWLDDVRPAPDGWVRVYWPDEVIQHLRERDDVTDVSLDHDLGDDERGTGYDVLLWIEEQVALSDYVSPRLHIHSDNASAVQRMRLAIMSIKRFEARGKKSCE